MNPTPPLLLTGAGFTRDFGGFLADEMFALIQTSVRRNPMLFGMLKATLDYEEVYGRVVIQKTAGGTEEQTALIAAVENAYARLDDAIRRSGLSPPVSRDHLSHFIGKFAGRARDARGYFFTLNQDLFVERYLGISTGDVPLVLHGQVTVPADLHQNPSRKLGSDDYVVLGSNAGQYREGDATSSSTFHYVKLHGSMIWRSNVNRHAMVVGAGKEELIAKEPLLAYYFDTFEEEISQTGRRLCVIGYGFRDPHINQRIANALERNDLQLFVISPQSPREFRDALRGAEGVQRGHVIFERAVHWPWTLSQIFPSGLSRRERSPWAQTIEAELFA